MEERYFEHEIILNEVRDLRTIHPRMGGRKLYELLEPFMLEHQVKMGRDALFNLLSSHNMLVKRRKRQVRTTNSYHRFYKYPNLIRTFVPKKANQLWVSDITYWKVGGSFLYISLITDVFSHKIVGYQLADNMEAIESIRALEMALEQLDYYPELIHHSDRGIQYCSHQYVKLLKDYGIKISMTESGDPLENAVAERVNGIIKNEYLDCYVVTDFNNAKDLLGEVIKLYNNNRPHMSIGYKTPELVHKTNYKTIKKWKSYFEKSTKL